MDTLAFLDAPKRGAERTVGPDQGVKLAGACMRALLANATVSSVAAAEAMPSYGAVGQGQALVPL